MRVRLRGGVVVLSVYLFALGAFAQDASSVLPLPPPAATLFSLPAFAIEAAVP